MPHTNRTATDKRGWASTSSTHVPFDSLPDAGFIRLRQLIPAVIPLSPATFWRRVRDGAKDKTFPQPISLGPNVTAFRVGEVRAWLEAQGSR